MPKLSAGAASSSPVLSGLAQAIIISHWIYCYGFNSSLCLASPSSNRSLSSHRIDLSETQMGPCHYPAQVGHQLTIASKEQCKALGALSSTFSLGTQLTLPFLHGMYRSGCACVGSNSYRGLSCVSTPSEWQDLTVRRC